MFTPPASLGELAPSAEASPKAIFAELNCLVVDDDELIRLTIKTILRAFSTGNVFEACSGTEALQMLGNRNSRGIDAIICDLDMPGMDGMEFLRNLATQGAGIPVIVASSHDDALGEAVRKMALAYGITLLGYIQKPILPGPLKVLLLKHKSQSLKAVPHNFASPVFTLDEILQGIQERQFEPFYQPKIDFKTGFVGGAEALARWRHSLHGVVSPSAFVETLKKSGKTDGLTFLILEKAVAACRLLHDRGQPITISVNVSQDLLSDPLLANKITQVIKGAGVDPQYIMLEITESTAMTHVAPALESLARLRMHGVGLSIDDFGTGVSNFQHISTIAFNELKIDRSFVKGCTNDAQLCTVVEACIEMAHQLKMKCVAEGVETRQDWDTLKEMGCDMAQGYLIASPMDLSCFLDFCSLYLSAKPFPV